MIEHCFWLVELFRDIKFRLSYFLASNLEVIIKHILLGIDETARETVCRFAILRWHAARLGTPVYKIVRRHYLTHFFSPRILAVSTCQNE